MIEMDEESGPLPAPIVNPRTVSHFVSMKHKFETAKLRDLLREVKSMQFFSFSQLIIRIIFYFYCDQYLEMSYSGQRES